MWTWITGAGGDLTYVVTWCRARVCISKKYYDHSLCSGDGSPAIRQLRQRTAELIICHFYLQARVSTLWCWEMQLFLLLFQNTFQFRSWMWLSKECCYQLEWQISQDFLKLMTVLIFLTQPCLTAYFSGHPLTVEVSTNTCCERFWKVSSRSGYSYPYCACFMFYFLSLSGLWSV